MGAGFLTASVLESATHVRTAQGPLPPLDAVLRTATQLFGAHVAAYASIATLQRAGALSREVALDALSFIDGTLFACGLGLSGMTSPARVAQFLDVSKGQWNPTLMFVMGGGLVLTGPFMQALVLPKRLSRPLVGSGFELQCSRELTGRLILGGLLFGAGWAIGGMCPGPALVNIASPHGAPLAWIGAMFAGLRLADVPLSSLGWGNPALKDGHVLEDELKDDEVKDDHELDDDELELEEKRIEEGAPGVA